MQNEPRLIERDFFFCLPLNLTLNIGERAKLSRKYLKKAFKVLLKSLA